MMRLNKFTVTAIIVSCIFIFLSMANTALFEIDIKMDTNKKVFNKQFSAADGQKAKLIVTNGAGWPKVRVLKVKLNNELIVTKKDVNKKVASFKTNITLSDVNKLKIIVRGRPGRVQLEIIPTDDDDGGGGGGGKSKPLFKRVVGYGDSLMAGFQDGTLVEDFQVWSLGAQLAQQAETKYVQPLISEPGIPPRQIKIENGQLVLVDSQDPGYRINRGDRLNNFAVPAFTTRASIVVTSGNALIDEILEGYTELNRVLDRNPSLVLLWIGSNDVLGMATNTDPDDHTDLDDFKTDYELIITELQKTGSKIVAANLPDITTIAFLVEPTNYMQISKDNRVPLTLYLDNLLRGRFTIPTPDQYLDPTELAQIRSTVQEFNAEIAGICNKYDIPLIDVYTITQGWETSGELIGGIRLTTEFRGGIFSLDGIHPTNTTHALLANEFIKIINQEFDKSVPLVDVYSVLQLDPNRPTAEESWESRPASEISGIKKSMERTLRMLNSARERKTRLRR